MTKRASIASLISASQDIYRKIVFEIADGIIGIDDHGIIRLCNPAAERMFGWEDGGLIERPLEVLLPPRIRAVHQQLLDGFRRGGEDARYMGQRASTIIGCRRDGSEINLGITILRTTTAGEPIMIAVVRDITDHVRYQDDLKKLAETDSLSGLLNRRAFRANVLQGLVRETGAFSSMAIFDLDDFKGVNDRFGHDAGDEVIVAFADVLHSSIRASDVVGRWGGEEFVLFLPGAARGQATAVVERIRSHLAERIFNWNGSDPASFTVSAGLCTAAAGSADFSDMISAADGALYEAKRNGRNRLTAVDITNEALAS